MIVIDLRVVLADDANLKQLWQLLGVDLRPLGLAQLKNDGFGRLIPDMDGAITMRTSPDRDKIREALGHGRVKP